MAAGAAPGPHLAGARRPVRDALHLGHHRPPQGLRPPPPQRHVHDDRWSAVEPARYQDETILSILPYFHVTGMQGGMNAPIYAGVSIVLLPRWDRDVAAQLIQRYAVTGFTAVPTMIVDLLSNPKLASYDLSSLRQIGGGGAAMPEAVAQKLQDLCGLDVHRGLRPERDHRADPHQPAAAAQEAVPRHPDVQHRRAGGQPRHPGRAAARRGRRDRLARAAGVRRLLEQPPGQRGLLRRARGQAVLPHRRPGAHRRGWLLLPGRSPQAHDQRLRLQGLAGRGRGDAVRPPRHPGGR